MTQVPDAPWIREAELNGYPGMDGPEPVCPICGKKCETIYTGINLDPVGCDVCLTPWEAYEWCDEHREEDEP